MFCRYSILLKQDFQHFEFTLFSQLSCKKWYATAYLAYMLGAPLHACKPNAYIRAIRSFDMSSLQPSGGLVRSTSGRKRHLKRTDKKRTNVVTTDTVKEQQVRNVHGREYTVLRSNRCFTAATPEGGEGSETFPHGREARISLLDAQLQDWLVFRGHTRIRPSWESGIIIRLYFTQGRVIRLYAVWLYGRIIFVLNRQQFVKFVEYPARIQTTSAYISHWLLCLKHDVFCCL